MQRGVCPRRLPATCLALAGVLAAGNAGGETVVRKVAESFEGRCWAAGQWSKAGGGPKSSGDVPGELAAASAKSMVQEVSFSGKGFEFYSADPPERLAPLHEQVYPQPELSGAKSGLP